MTMASILRQLSFLGLLVIITISKSIGEPFLGYSCVNGDTVDSIYKINLAALLFDLTSNKDIDYGFYNFSYGENSDKVNVIAMCRGDVKPDDCRNCLNNSSIILPQLCPNNKEAIGWWDNCMLHYSNRSILGLMEVSPSFYIKSPYDTTDEQFNQVLFKLLEFLRNTAASGDSCRKFVAGSGLGPSLQTIYALGQCTPDLSEQLCKDCLAEAISQFRFCCFGKLGGQVLSPSCNMRYEIYGFYGPAAEAQQPSAPIYNNKTSAQEKTKTSSNVIRIVVTVVAFDILLIFVCIYLRKRKQTKYAENEAENYIITTKSLEFDFHAIRVATNDFSEVNKLGEGGFGAVYRGRLPNEQEVAVKRLSRDSTQGDSEFKNEVLLLAQLQHRNLVRLLGFCLEKTERLLIYEFLPNASLDYFIFDSLMHINLDWEGRYKIILGIARGILYLHEDSQLRIIHRDLKASNILLDEQMNPKISDFGMAILFEVDQSQDSTSTIRGTIGYMAPEYAMHGHFSVKSDVFSFGVLVLEIVSGQKNSSTSCEEDFRHLLTFAWESWREGAATNVVDPTLSDGPRNEIMKCIHIGLLCVQANEDDRPTIFSVVHMLDSNSLTLPIHLQPGFFMNGRSLCDKSATKSQSVQVDTNEALITEIYPR